MTKVKCGNMNCKHWKKGRCKANKIGVRWVGINEMILPAGCSSFKDNSHSPEALERAMEAIMRERGDME